MIDDEGDDDMHVLDRKNARPMRFQQFGRKFQ